MAATTWSLEDWKLGLASAAAHLKRDRLTVAAGAFAFRWFLSIFPMVIALLGVASLVGIPHHVVTSLVRGLDKALPSGAAEVLQRAVVHASEGQATLSATVVAGVVGLWSGLSGMVMLEEGLDMAFELGQDRSFLRKRLLAVPLLAAAGILGGAASALVVFGPQLGRLIQHNAPVAGVAFLAVWTVVRWAAALVLMVLLMGALYHLAPNRRQATWRLGSAGALVATLLWALISLGFSYYTTSFSSYGNTYGAFAGVALLSIWLFLTGLAILLGGEVDAAFERQRAAAARAAGAAVAAKVPPPSPGTSRPLGGRDPA